MLAELHVVDLGIVADLDLVLGPGLTAITGETGAGKTLLVEALELLVGGAADPALVRDGAAEARVEGRFVDPRPARRSCSPGSSPPTVAAGRTSTAGSRPSGELARARRAPRRPARPARAPVAARAGDAARGARPFAGPPALEAARGATAPRARSSRGVDDRARRARRRRPGPGARDRPAALPGRGDRRGAGIDDPDEDAALEAEEDAARRRRRAPGSARGRARRAGGPALDALGVAAAALDGRPPFARARRSAARAQAELADVAHELRLAAEAVVDDPERLEAVRAAPAPAARAAPQVRRHPRRGDGVPRRRRGAARRARGLRGARRRARGGPGRGRRPRPRRPPATLSEAARRGRAARWPRRRRSTCGSWRCRTPTSRSRSRPGEPTDDGADRVTFLLAPNPGETARPLARAASGGELSRAMLALRVVLAEAPADARVRRGRRGHRR